MSACPHAEPIGPCTEPGDTWIYEADGETPLSAEECRKLDAQPILCRGCGWQGKMHELLTCGDTEGDCSTMLWCPVCETIGWEYL